MSKDNLETLGQAGAVRCPICGGRKKTRKDSPRLCKRCHGKGYVMVDHRDPNEAPEYGGPVGTTWIPFGDSAISSSSNKPDGWHISGTLGTFGTVR